MAPTCRGRVYQFVADAPNGATRQEISDGLTMRLQTVCGRVAELKRMGLIWEGDETRQGRKVLRPSRSL